MTIQIISEPSSKVISFNIDGKIEVEDIDCVVRLIEKKLEKEKKLRIYAEVNHWSGMSLKALIKDLLFGLKHFQDFEKEAIVSNSQWLKNLTTVVNSLFFSIEVKHFTLAEKAQAMEWIAS